MSLNCFKLLVTLMILNLKFKTNELCNAVSAVNSDLNEICRWCCHNSLLVNPDKTTLLVIGVPQLLRQLPDYTITLCGKPTSSTPVAKDLGVFLDQCLSYNEHIRKTVASCINKLIQINRIKHLLDKETLLLIIALSLAGCFIAPQFGAIPRQLTSICFSLFKMFQPGLSWDFANMSNISAGLRSL